MTTRFSVCIDWDEEWKRDDYLDRWVNHGRNVMQELASNDYDRFRRLGNDRIVEFRKLEWDHRLPLMNYCYPLFRLPSEEQIIQICSRTCLTVMENRMTGEVLLVVSRPCLLLSQDIALAYLLAGQRIPISLALIVSKEYGLSWRGDDWFKIAKACQKELEENEYLQSAKQWQAAINSAKKEIARNQRFEH